MNIDTPRVGWSISEWGSRYGMSRALAYKIVRSGKGPATAVIPGSTKQIVTAEADLEYRERLNRSGKAA